MARIRSIKPQFFRHRDLFAAEIATGLPLRVAFAGLWTCADKEGRFKWVPEELKLDCLPYDPVDFSKVLFALVEHGFIVRYACGEREYGCIPTFKEHQIINNREADSTLPPPPSRKAKATTRAPRVPHACPTEASRDSDSLKGKGREGNEEGEQEGEQEGKGGDLEARADAARSPKIRGSRLPDDWQPSEGDSAFAEARGFVGQPLRDEILKFKNHWANATGKGAAKLDWSKAWETWILNAVTFNARRGRSPPRGQPVSFFQIRQEFESRRHEPERADQGYDLDLSADSAGSDDREFASDIPQRTGTHRG